MRVYSFRLRPGRIAAVLCAAAVLFFGGNALLSEESAIPVFGLFKKGIAGETPEQRLEYIASFGWQVQEIPVSETEVTIPREFDELYESYNELQKSQGFDLSKYRGDAATKYLYLITNYPDGQEAVVTLLVRKGRIIGADVSGTGAESFTHSMEMPKTV